jgi:hypothetical protein
MWFLPSIGVAAGIVIGLLLAMRRFNLRILLIVMTTMAILLGLAGYALRERKGDILVFNKVECPLFSFGWHPFGMDRWCPLRCVWLRLIRWAVFPVYECNGCDCRQDKNHDG